MSDKIDFFGALADQAPAEDNLIRLSKLVQKAADLKDDFDYHAEKSAEAEEAMKKVLREEIPELMAEIGMSEVRTEEGMLVSVEGKINCAIKAVNKPEAFAWLREHDYDGLIKSKLSVEFGKGEDESAAAAIKALDGVGIVAGVEDNIHPATLKSWAKERVEAGDTLPECFSIHEFKEAKITVPKAKKSGKIK
ncbi:hypothetical protein [Serratia phage SMP]|uniref:Ig-like domain-containing protein n=2 Tax=Myosmarvirus TaxID=2843428 RepID=A0A9E8G770_9CAUD|nr:hypothetical protein [Serratia phage SMP]